MNSKKNKFLPYIIAFSAGLLFAGAICLITVLTSKSVDYSAYRSIIVLLADATFVTGVVIVGVGLIAFIAKKGTFDSLGFAVESVLVVRNWSPKRRFKERESFSEYKERKEEARKEKKGLSFLYPVGGIYILASVILVIVYSVT